MHMLEIMPCRQVELERSLEALNKTDIPLLSVYNSQYAIAGGSDDKGMYYFIPTLAKTLGLSIDQASQTFYFSIILLGIATAACGFFFLFKSWLGRLIAFFGLLILATYLTGGFGRADVYLAGFFSVTAILPFFIAFSHRSMGFNPYIALILAFSGIIIGYCNLLRHHAGTGTLLFLCLWIFLAHSFQKKEKIICFFILFISFLAPHWHFHLLEKKRDAFLVEHSGADPKKIGFPTWHVIHNGLGYLKNNKYGLGYYDECTMNAVQKVNPQATYLSEEYYLIVKNLVLDLFRNDFRFVFHTIIAKTFNILLKAILYTNISLLLLFYVRPSKQIFIPCLFASLFYAIPGVLVMPFYYYVSGMVATLVIFALYVINLSIEKVRSASSIQSA